MSKYAITLFILIVGITTISIGTTLIHGLAAEEQQSKQSRSLCNTFGGCGVARSFGEQNQANGLQSQGETFTARSNQQEKMVGNEQRQRPKQRQKRREQSLKQEELLVETGGGNGITTRTNRRLVRSKQDFNCS